MAPKNTSPPLVVIAEAIGLVLLGGGALAQQASTGPAGEPRTSAPSPQAGSVYVPESSRPQPGSSAHTNYRLRSSDGKKPAGVKAPSEGAFGGPRAQ